MHSIVQRPMVVAGKIEARPMMYVALTYDHRLVDGREVRAVRGVPSSSPCQQWGQEVSLAVWEAR